MGGSAANGQAIHRQDHWSRPVFVMAGVLCLMLLLQIFFDDELTEHALFFQLLGQLLSAAWVLCFVAYGCIAAVALLFTRRPRRATSHLLAIGALAATVFSFPAVAAAGRTFWFRSQLPRYEKLIAGKRANTPAATPVRLVVDMRDLSLFVTTTLLENIVYDETDEVLTDPCLVLKQSQCAVTPSGFAASDGSLLSVSHIEGHFYRIMES